LQKQEIIIPKINVFKAILVVALKSWVVLASSWAFFIYSYLYSWEIPASGAVLVCGALLSEIFYQNQNWTKMNTDPSGIFRIIPNGINGNPIIKGQYITAPAGAGKLGSLISLANDYELKNVAGAYEMRWHYNDTVSRLERNILWCTVLTAVMGTFIWGYGHLIF